MEPIKVRIAQRMIRKAGGTILSGGKHLKVVHPDCQETFTLPSGGSKGRQTLSPGMTHEFHKFHAKLLEIKNSVTVCEPAH